MLKFEPNWLHVGALALANFLIGFAWYSFLFVKPWVKALGMTPERMGSPESRKRMPVLMGAAALTAFLLSLGSQVLVSSLGAADPVSGAEAGLFVSLVFVLPHESGSLFEGRPYVVYGIGALHAAVVVVLDCSLHAAWH